MRDAAVSLDSKSKFWNRIGKVLTQALDALPLPRLLELFLIGRAMRMYSAPTFFAPSHVVCPDCGEPMRLLNIVPVQTEDRTDEIRYRCDACNVEHRQVTRPLVSRL